MRRTVPAAALAVALSAVAPAAQAGVFCYLEGSVGKNVTSTRVSDDLSGPITIAADGSVAGLGAGCDYTQERMLFGVLARYDLSDLQGTIGDQSISGDAMWTAALRAGIKLNEGTLAYALGGIAGTDVTLPGGIKINPHGLVWGGGLEIDLGYQNLSLFLEYNHVAWSKSTIDETSVRPDSDVFRVGVKFKFGSADMPKILP